MLIKNCLTIVLIAVINCALSTKPINDLMNQYETWGKQHGVSISNKLQITAKSLNDKSFQVLRDIEPNQMLLSIPQALLLSVTKSLSFHDELIENLHNYTFNETSFSYDDPFFNDYNREVIYLSLLRYYSNKAKDKVNELSTFYEPYFNTYEDDVSNFPLFYTTKELKPLDLLDFGIKIIVRKAYIDEERVLIRMNYDKTLDENVYTKYRHLTKAKTHLVNNATTLIPFLELFSIALKEKSNCEWKMNDEAKQIEVYSTRPIKTGEELYVPIDEKSNDELLLDYGKTIEDNLFIKEYLIDIIHHTWRDDDKLRWVSGEDERFRYNLMNLTFTTEFLKVYKEIAKEKSLPQDDVTAYGLMIKNLQYYLDEYDRGNDSVLKENIVNEANRVNVKRILDNERMLIQQRIDLLKQLIVSAHKTDL